MFLLRDFGSKIDRKSAKHLGQWSTRLYIILLLTSFTILALFTIVQPEPITKVYNKPSFNLYNQLSRQYGNELKCLCSSISSTYNQFVELEPVFHPICSSPFSSDEWRMNLAAGLVAHLSTYLQRDYRRFLSAHLQYLQGLCRLSIELVNNSVNQFLASLMITTQMLSETAFNQSLDLLIQQAQSTTPTKFSDFFFLLGSINHGNVYMSTYGTNFEYISRWYFQGTYLSTRDITYDDECSCGIYSNCTSQASFIDIANYSQIVPLKGLKIGCTPSESFHLSTLECFYDRSCIDLIEKYANYENISNSTKSPILLATQTSRFSMNTTVFELLNNLFVEKWSTKLNYSTYYQQCSLSLCSHTYSQQFNPLYTVTLLLSLHGGLTIILKLICPKIIQILNKINNHRKKRMNIIQPNSSIEITTIDNINTNVHNTTCNIDSISMNRTFPSKSVSPIRCAFKVFLGFILIIFIIIGLIIFSIYVAQQKTNQVELPKSSTTVIISINTQTNMTTTTTTTASTKSSTTTSFPIQFCNLTFDPIIIYPKNQPTGINRKSSAVADLNNDDRLDFIYISTNPNAVNVLLGNGNGTFRVGWTLITGTLNTLGRIITGNFNSDNKPDLVFVDQYAKTMNIVFGNGNGTFGLLKTWSIGNESSPQGITAADFNGDNYLDIAVANMYNNNISLFFGNGNGSFSAQTTVSTGRNSNPYSISVSDFNVDGYIDIVVDNDGSRTIGILLGFGNGSFQSYQTYFIGAFYRTFSFAIGDFNSDRRPDVVFTYFANSDGNEGIYANYNVSIFFGYGNGTLSPKVVFPIANLTRYPVVSVGDVNGDGYLDIIATVTNIYYSISIFIGDGKGNFQPQLVSTILDNSEIVVSKVADFNGDGYQDILALEQTSGGVVILLNKGWCYPNTTAKTSTLIY